MARIGILGGGIGGLSLAYFLSKKHDVDLFEAENRVGGWIRTKEVDGFLFESGPRSFRTRGKGQATLRLISELGIEKELISPSINARKRYILHQGKLEEVPGSLPAFFQSPLTFGIKRKILTGLFRAPHFSEEMSVFSFFEKRFSSEFANRFIDPLCRGIFGGDARKLSFEGCFSSLAGYLQKPFFPSLFFPEFAKPKLKDPFLSFKNGLETLPMAIFERLADNVYLKKNAVHVSENKRTISVDFQDGTSFEGDYLISTLPLFSLGSLLDLPLLYEIPYLSLTILELGYRKTLLKKEGFGYLVPSRENRQILGAIFDSSAFPSHNKSLEETRISIMVEGVLPKEQAKEIAKETVFLHLGIKDEPESFSITKAVSAIPQFHLGYEALKCKIKHAILKKNSRLIPAGSALLGVAINDAIYFAESLQKKEIPF